MDDSRRWTRRVVGALLILAVAGGLSLWSAHRRTASRREVESFVLALCDDLAGGRDPMPRLGGTDPVIAGPLLERLRAVVGPGASAGVTVTVSSGDVEGVGSAPPASHTAVIRAGEGPSLGVRLVHRDPGGTVVVGVFAP